MLLKKIYLSIGKFNQSTTTQLALMNFSNKFSEDRQLFRRNLTKILSYPSFGLFGKFYPLSIPKSNLEISQKGYHQDHHHQHHHVPTYIYT